jgi:hypothetical protein
MMISHEFAFCRWAFAADAGIAAIGGGSII